MKLDATPENLALYEAFKAMALATTGAKVECRIKNGKIASDHDSETYMMRRDPIWKFVHSDDLKYRSRVRRAAERLIDSVVDATAPENNVYESDDYGHVTVTHRPSGRFFTIHILHRYLDFGIAPYSFHYERLAFSEKVKTFLRNAFTTQKHMPLAYLTSFFASPYVLGNYVWHMEHRGDKVSECTDRSICFPKAFFVDKDLVQIALTERQPRRKEFTSMITVPHDGSLLAAVRDLYDEALHRGLEEHLAWEEKRLDERVGDLKGTLLEAESEQHEFVTVTRKRQRDDLETFVKTFKPKLE